MSKNKDYSLKEYLGAQRRKIGAGISGAPVWVMQKAGKRIWNMKHKKHWRSTNFGSSYRRENDLV